MTQTLGDKDVLSGGKHQRGRLCEHTFVIAQGSAQIRFTRAIQNRSVILAEIAAHELERLGLDDALALVYLYGETNDPKFERAAVRWLTLWITETSPSLRDIAGTACGFVERQGG